jgi:hypothetical protein
MCKNAVPRTMNAAHQYVVDGSSHGDGINAKPRVGCRHSRRDRRDSAQTLE